tara:strand:- start:1993 stop:4248 length:2256 start_codon:yes stop_codon:yes gene_type:complete
MRSRRKPQQKLPFKRGYKIRKGNNSQGVGGAVMSGLSSILSKEKLLPSIWKAIKAYGTPGSGVTQGLKLGSTIAGKSDNPQIQNLGKLSGFAGNLTGLLGGEGGENMDFSKILETLKDKQGASGMRVTKSYQPGGVVPLQPIQPSNINPNTGKVDKVEVRGMGGYDEAIQDSGLDQGANTIVDAIPGASVFKGIGEGFSKMIVGDSTGDERKKKQKISAALFSPHKLISMFKQDKQGGSAAHGMKVKTLKSYEKGGEVHDSPVGELLAALSRKSDPNIRTSGNMPVAEEASSKYLAKAMRTMNPQQKTLVMGKQLEMPVEDVAKMVYQYFGKKKEAAHGMKVLKSYDEGGNVNGNGDPVPEGEETYGTPRVIKTTTAAGEYQEDKPLTGGDYQPGGTIGAVNPEGGSLDALDDQKKEDILKSEFGQTYLSGEGSLDDQYKDYTIKVNNFIDNDPEQALANINKMIETNPGFEAKLKGKSDEEKLSITRTMMTDGKIGDFHGTILMGEKETPLPQFYTPRTANIRGEQGADIFIGSGMRALKENQMEDYLAAAEEAGISREELSQETDKTRDFLNQYLDEHGSQQSSPSTTTERGTSTGGMSQYFIDEAKKKAAEHLQSRSEQASTKARDWYAGINPAWAAQQDEMQQLATYNEQEGTDFRNTRDMKADMAEKHILSLREDKKGHMADITEEGRPAFMDEYFKSRGIDSVNATEGELLAADRAYERSLKRGASGMRVLKHGGRQGALRSLIR